MSDVRLKSIPDKYYTSFDLVNLLEGEAVDFAWHLLPLLMHQRKIHEIEVRTDSYDTQYYWED